VEELCLFLGGAADQVLERLRLEMEGHAERLEYEAASRVRDRIQLMERTLRRQKMVDIHQREADILAISRAGDLASGVVLQVRDGRVLGKERRTLRGTAEQDDAAVMAAFVTQYYMRSDTVPPQVITAIEPEERETIEAWLTGRAGRRVELRQARRGPLAGLVRLALQNARLDQEQGRAAGKARRLSPVVYELQAALSLRAATGCAISSNPVLRHLKCFWQALRRRPIAPAISPALRICA
jgi:excinuclease ABC subunit C